MLRTFAAVLLALWFYRFMDAARYAAAGWVFVVAVVCGVAELAGEKLARVAARRASKPERRS